MAARIIHAPHVLYCMQAKLDHCDFDHCDLVQTARAWGAQTGPCWLDLDPIPLWLDGFDFAVVVTEWQLAGELQSIFAQSCQSLSRGGW